MKPLVFTILSCILFFSTYAQKSEDAKPNFKDEVWQLYTEHFESVKYPDFSFNVSLQSFWLNFDDLPDPINYDSEYLKELKKELLLDEKNPLTHNSLAEWYKNNQDYRLMETHFLLTNEYLSMDYFKGDTAFFYSFRAVLKTNLGEPSYMEDYETALSINPNDPLALSFYPMALIMQSEYDVTAQKLKLFYEKGGDENLYYFFIRFNEVLRAMQKIMFSEKYLTFEEIRGVFSIVGEYEISMANLDLKYAVDQQFKMFELLTLWGYFFDIEYDDSKAKDTKNYKLYKKLLRQQFKHIELQKKKGIINDYLYHKTLGYCYFFQGNEKKMLPHLRKALSIFPTSKRDFTFDENDIYSALICQAAINKDDKGSVKIIDDFLSDDSRYPNLDYEIYRLSLLVKLGRIDDAIRDAQNMYMKNRKSFSQLLFLTMVEFKENRLDMVEVLLPELEQSVSSHEEHYQALVFIAALMHYVQNFDGALSFLNQAEQYNKEHKLFDVESETLHYKVGRLVKKYR